ncbi:MAG: response regulator transcription factor [Rubrivivax sp.]|nr:response regulator transcription factor [Rubrivivax sp.]
MKVLIAEDEAPARERLLETLARVAPQAVVVGQAASVRELRLWLAAHPEPDLLLLDIQLADGLSLELFRDWPLALPTVFTTAYDEFALQAFQALAVDYLLKPVSDERLAMAFAKVERLRERYTAQAAQALFERLQAPAPAAVAARRQRWVARQGSAWVAVPTEQVACFVALDKSTVLLMVDGTRATLDEPLADVEAALDPQAYFRANRQTLLAAAAVRRFAPAGKGRLVVELSAPGAPEIQIPQERAAAFKQWIAR